MPDATPANAAQIDYWNNSAGLTWAAMQAQLDRQIEPLGARAMEGFAPRPGVTVLDIGCGCGQTTLALAERVGASGVVTGVDISRPMLEVARARSAPAGAAPQSASRVRKNRIAAPHANSGRASFSLVVSARRRS